MNAVSASGVGAPTLRIECRSSNGSSTPIQLGIRLASVLTGPFSFRRSATTLEDKNWPNGR
jgi:hypothetical protein